MAIVDSAAGLEVVGAAASASAGIPRILALRPDVVVLDTVLPDGDGIELCRAIRAREPLIRVLALNAIAADDKMLFDAIRGGVSGYLQKHISGAELVDAVRRVAEGQSLLDPAVIAQLLDRLSNGAPQAPDELRRLSEREADVLRFVAEGLTNREIADRMHLAEKTVKTYVSSMMAKLGVTSRVKAAVLATQLLSAPTTAGTAA
jgi:two-component system response regulator DevR